MKPKKIRKISYAPGREYPNVPFLPLAGKYLKELGFEIGDWVEVEYDHGLITIRWLRAGVLSIPKGQLRLFPQERKGKAA
jgi:anaerobic selenocysteine-containing dehydrogenase